MKPNDFPRFFYGTAWKEADTAELTFLALQNGFRAIDTANQRKHYFEEAVGDGLKRAFAELNLRREDIFLQTKFTFARGQDNRKPYNESDAFTKQVQDSFASSLQHLQTDFIDSLVLHGPSRPVGIGADDLEVWQSMESLKAKGAVKHLGISNISAGQLTELCQKVKDKPTFVQNRCFANQKWDQPVRAICEKENIVYQGFSLLTANQMELSHPKVIAMAKKYQKTVPQVTFRFCVQLGMICLTGTNNPAHMLQDLDVNGFELNEAEVSLLENVSFL